MIAMELAFQHRQLIDGWQRALPLVERPFAAIGSALGCSEEDVVAGVAELKAAGVISRVGATVRPNTIGTSLLAAMKVPADRLDEVAAIVNREPAVNHNYERENSFNLWFVVTAGDAASLTAALQRLRAATGLEILELPMERAYYLDLGFPIDLSGQEKAAVRDAADSTKPISPADRQLLVAMENGLSIGARPYRDLGRLVGLSESDVIERLTALVAAGIVSRLGLIVRHRRLGIAANAMAVWNIDDLEIDRVGHAFAASPHVTLCYRRPRRLPDWPYNLFTMIHGRDRSSVEAQIQKLADDECVSSDRRAILFSRRCFMQRGARYRAA